MTGRETLLDASDGSLDGGCHLSGCRLDSLSNLLGVKGAVLLEQAPSEPEQRAQQDGRDRRKYGE
jgi:hypothetical protein